MSLRHLQRLFFLIRVHLLTRFLNRRRSYSFSKKIQNTRNKKNQNLQGIKYEKKKVEGPICFFGLLGHQVCLGTKQLKITIFFYL
jgi:hypothetical protein